MNKSHIFFLNDERYPNLVYYRLCIPNVHLMILLFLFVIETSILFTSPYEKVKYFYSLIILNNKELVLNHSLH